LRSLSGSLPCTRLDRQPRIAIDGKSLHGTPANNFCGVLHLVSAWDTEAGLLLALLHLRGGLVTLDAGGCQKSNAAAIREKKGDYLPQWAGVAVQRPRREGERRGS
jgi:hypothetical protein